MAKDLGTVTVAVRGEASAADPTLSKKLDTLLTLVQSLIAKVAQMASDVQTALDNLTAEVTETKTVSQSAIVLLNGLSAQIAALKTASTDPATAAAIDALKASLDQSNADLAAGVTANTPAEG